MHNILIKILKENPDKEVWMDLGGVSVKVTEIQVIDNHKRKAILIKGGMGQ